MPGEEPVVETGTKYLNPRAQKTASIAIRCGPTGTAANGGNCPGNASGFFQIFIHDDHGMIDTTRKKEELIDSLEKDITIFLTEISQGSLSQQQSQTITSLMHFSSDLERIGDHAHNIIHLAEIKMEEGLSISNEAASELHTMHEMVDQMITQAMEAF